jgi:ubiquinone/menaquinone biosynthesis C-methylase UbiE
MVLPMLLIFKNIPTTHAIMSFKKKVLTMTDKEFSDVYRNVSSRVKRDSDLNKESFDKIMHTVSGKTVLDVGCGRGALAIALSKNYVVTASDIIIDREIAENNTRINFVQAKAEALPFTDKQFDTVVCTHTLEHLRGLQEAISELRRVSRKRLIVVVPMQRPYKYTFDLHIHFFPYPESLTTAMGLHPNATCEEIGGDLFYVEER